MTSNLSLALAHGRYLVVENLRIPIAVLSTAAFPAATLVFFVVPFAQTASPEASAIAIAQLAVFAVMCGYLFNFGIGAADDREHPWDPYLRTLPAPAWPRIAGRVLNGLVFAAMGVVPLLVIGGLTTSATATPLQLLLGLLALVVAGLPFLFGGLAIGYSMSVKAANAATQIAVFPVAFGGGLLLPPWLVPEWLHDFSTALPSRGARDLVVWAAVGPAPDVAGLVVLAGWTVLTFGLAVWAFRRDEGRRFR